MNPTPSMKPLATAMRKRAERGVVVGDNTATRYFHDARRLHHETETFLIFTRDTHYHQFGVLALPELDRCYHLAVSFWQGETTRPFDVALADTWVRLFFGGSDASVWSEVQIVPGAEIRHYRLFCDPNWQPMTLGESHKQEFVKAKWTPWLVERPRIATLDESQKPRILLP